MVSVQSTVDTGHEDMVHDAQMDYYGTRLATCSSDRVVKIFEVRSGGQTHSADLHGHEGPVWQVAWAHPRFGKILASCSYDTKVFLWREDRPGSWNKIYEHSAHSSSVNSVSWAPSDLGLVLACGSSDGAISIIAYSEASGAWEVAKISNAHAIGCNAVSWAPTHAGGKRIVSGGCDSLVRTWRSDGVTGQWSEESKLEAHSDWVRDVAWAPSVGAPPPRDVAWAPSIGAPPPRDVIASCSQDRRVIVWTQDSHSRLWMPKTVHTFDSAVWHVSWSLTGNILAVSAADNKVSLWKETLEGEWACISDVSKGQSAAATQQG